MSAAALAPAATAPQQLTLIPVAAMPGPSAIKFYRLIQRLAAARDKVTKKARGHTIAGQEALGRMAERSDRMVRNYIKELEDAGWIEVQRDPGKRSFLRPLVQDVPDRSVSHVPTPPAAWSVPQKYVPANQANGAETGQNGAQISGVVSGVSAAPLLIKAPFGGIFSDRKESKQKQSGEQAAKRSAGAPEIAYANPAEARVAADLKAFGIWESEIPRLVAAIPVPVLDDAMAITAWRKKRGEPIGGENGGLGGYVKALAARLHTGDWERPKRWLQEVGRLPVASAKPKTEYQKDRDRQANLRTVRAAAITPPSPQPVLAPAPPAPVNPLDSLDEATREALAEEARRELKKGARSDKLIAALLPGQMLTILARKQGGGS